MWIPKQNSGVDQFLEGDWPVSPADQYPIYSEQLFTEEESTELFHALLSGYATKGYHQVYQSNGRVGQLDRSARDTHDLSNRSRVLIERRAEERMIEAGYRGTKYLSGTEKKLLPTVALQVLGYEKKGRFIQHADSHIYISKGGKMVWEHNSPERKYSSVCWLSNYRPNPVAPNDFNGGKIRFPFLLDSSTQKEIVIEPKAGQFVLFPSHPLYSHEVVPVVRGYRLAIVSFWDIA